MRKSKEHIIYLNKSGREESGQDGQESNKKQVSNEVEAAGRQCQCLK